MKKFGYIISVLFVSGILLHTSSNISCNSEKQKLKQEIADLRSSLNAQKAKEEQAIAENKNTCDQLTKELNQEIEEKTIEIQQYREALTINMMDRIFFESGKADIRKKGYPVLDRVGRILKNIPDQNKIIQIEGHTDSVPISADYQKVIPNNWALGSMRAINVALYFIDNVGINPKRIEVVSFSKYRPRVPNTNSTNRAKNRRIEIVLVDPGLYKLMEAEQGQAKK